MDISLKEALIGFTKYLTHLDDRKIEITRDEVTQPGFKIKLTREGMPIHERSDEYGDLYITFNVIFPTHLDERQLKGKFI